MRIIILGDEFKHSHSFTFHKRWLFFFAAILCALVISVVTLSWLLQQRGQRMQLVQQQLTQLHQDLLQDQYQAQVFYNFSNGVFQEQAKQVGLLQARIARIEALGSRLADSANFDEFDFYSMPALGGPEDGDSEQILSPNDMRITLTQLNLQIDKREQELSAINRLLTNKQLQQEQYIAGMPATSGWLSSHFGKRIDPFTGHTAVHKGIDYAGKEGTAILAVASGVVVWAGDRYGYGNMVEINHGNGLSTRYAHSEKVNVKIGDVVTKGQVIAQMGSTGRSTGPHVHFEVLKNGQAVDPQKYIYRKSL